jgi:SAM-dependent methyltransferase
MEPTDDNRRAFDDRHRTQEDAVPRQGLPAAVEELFTDLAGRRVLHLLCDDGVQTVELAALGALVTGVDESTEAIAMARLRAPELPWLHADPHALPAELRRARFDLVYCGEGSLARLRDLAAWAGEVAAALRPGGTLVVHDDHPASACLDRFLRWRDDYFAAPTVGGLVSAVAAAGLTVRHVVETPSRSPWRRIDPRVPAELLLVAEKPI